MVSCFLLFSLFALFGFQGSALNLIVGVDCYEVPPVPIPNTEVKLVYVEDTWLVTARENRTMPIFKSVLSKRAVRFIYYTSIKNLILVVNYDLFI